MKVYWFFVGILVGGISSVVWLHTMGPVWVKSVAECTQRGASRIVMERAEGNLYTNCWLKDSILMSVVAE